TGDVARLGPARRRDAGEDRVAALGVLAQGVRVGGGDVPRGDGVDVDALVRPLVGERLGQARDGGLRGRVAGDVDAALEAEHRGRVDELAAAARGHGAADRARGRERGPEVDVDHVVEVLVGVQRGGGAADGPAVVDQDVDRATGEVRGERRDL